VAPNLLLTMPHLITSKILAAPHVVVNNVHFVSVKLKTPKTWFKQTSKEHGVREKEEMN